MIRYAAAVVFSLLAAQPALAQSPVPDARARADAIMAASGVTDLFENITEDDRPRVRHKGSGMVCSFSPDSPVSRIMLFPNPVRGNDVGCTEKVNDVLITLYATKVLPAPDLQRDFRGAIDSVRAIYPDAQPYKGLIADAAIKAPANQTTIFTFTDKEGRVTGKPGTVVISRISVAVVEGGWELKMRASAPQVQDEAEREKAGMAFSFQTGALWALTLIPFAPKALAAPAS